MEQRWFNRDHYDSPSKHLSAYYVVSTMIMNPLEHTLLSLVQLLTQNVFNYDFKQPSHLVKCLSQPITTKSIASVITLI